MRKRGSPPLARGIRYRLYEFAEPYRITPARAGNTSLAFTLNICYKDHPRSRGEYPASTIFLHVSKGSPPLARGILEKSEELIAKMRITPARAGNTYILI